MPIIPVALACWFVSAAVFFSGLPAPRIILTFAGLGFSFLLIAIFLSLYRLLKRD
jgi:hypothetical protein